MQRIKILPPDLANKIAAGEVVQRPASVLKELLENSIDAGATEMTVIIKDAGKALVQVTDNGGGMSTEDARMAFARHATSKIFSYDDLERIHTFGFRGEALASIAAVARVEMKTRAADAVAATKVTVEGGAETECTEDAASPGTTIQVKNLFYNTPGRRNFLKSNTTEFHHCLTVFNRVALAYPERSFTLISDGETMYNLRAEDSSQRLVSLFGSALARSVFPFEENQPYVRLSGFLGKPDFSRKTRIEQYLFLNRRPIANKSISHAAVKGYEHLLEKGSFPFFVLFMEIDSTHVDVNVHPSKLEVKFEDESAIYRSVFHAVRQALGRHDLQPVFEASMPREGVASGTFSGARPNPLSGTRIETWRDLIAPPPSAPSPQQESDAASPSGQPLVPAATGFPASEAAVRPPADIRLTQLHRKYILVPTENGFLLVDQHAAHERVLYERVIRRFAEHQPSAQQLLFPIVNEFTPAEVELVKELQPLLEQLGFALKIFGSTTVILDGIPSDVSPGSEKTILPNILDLYREDPQDVRVEPMERLAKSYSCKAAIKAGDLLGQPEMQALLDQLYATATPYVCPHGRPVSIKISLSELDRRFGRSS